MANYGMAVSADGYDVKTCADKDMVVTSKYSALKGSLNGSGTVYVSATDEQNGVWKTINIAHGLGHIPMAQGLAKDRNGIYFNQKYYKMTLFDYVAGTEIYWKISANSTNVVLSFKYDTDGAPGQAVTIDYTYFIFIDKGKL